MKYYELIGKANLANQIPLAYGENKLSSDTAANVVLLKVHYNSIQNKMQEALNEVVKSLKKEGFDERTADIENMKRVDSILKSIEEWKEGSKDSEGNLIKKPEMPSKEELEKADKAREIKEEYYKELEELNEVYSKAINKQLYEDIDFNHGLSKQDWKNIYDMMGIEGTIEFTYANGSKRNVSNTEYLQYLGELIVE